MDDIRWFWSKAVRVFRLPADGHGKQRTAVKRIMEGNDFGFERAMAHAGIVARQLKGGFVSFGTRVHEQHALGEGRINDFTAQAQRRFVGENVAGMPQGFTLGF